MNNTYTCKGKGGLYELVGVAKGAGESRYQTVAVYRDVPTGALYFREPHDFDKRMELVEAGNPASVAAPASAGTIDTPKPRSIAANKDFEHAAKSLHYDWTPHLVHKLIDVADRHAAAAVAEAREKAFEEAQQMFNAAESAHKMLSERAATAPVSAVPSFDAVAKAARVMTKIDDYLHIQTSERRDAIREALLDAIGAPPSAGAPVSAAEPKTVEFDGIAGGQELPALPKCKMLSGSALDSLHALYTADQMREYVLADRAMRQPQGDDTAASRDVLAERHRQVDMEGWTPEHDDAYVNEELRKAAVAYLQTWTPYLIPGCWPWPVDWWKPSNDRRNLVKSAALILAEIERIDRAAKQAGKEGV